MPVPRHRDERRCPLPLTALSLGLLAHHERRHGDCSQRLRSFETNPASDFPHTFAATASPELNFDSQCETMKAGGDCQNFRYLAPPAALAIGVAQGRTVLSQLTNI